MMKKYLCKSPIVWAVQWDGVNLNAIKQALPDYAEDDIRFGVAVNGGYLSELVVECPTFVWTVEPTDYVFLLDNDELHCLSENDFNDLYQEA